MKGNIEPEQITAARELLGSWLADLRKGKGLSQTTLAGLMGVDAATVSKIEAGKWGITIDMLALFCLHLEYPLDNLFTTECYPEA
jgi:transcriptional regulator with XRE-family HTH domain